jgi:hypothetical protein
MGCLGVFAEVGSLVGYGLTRAAVRLFTRLGFGAR